MLQIPESLGGPAGDDLAVGPFAVDTPYGQDIGYGLSKCDADGVVWADQDRVHTMIPDTEPTVRDDDSITFTATGQDIVIRPFKASDTVWMLGSPIERSVDDLRAYASDVLNTSLTSVSPPEIS